MRRNLMAAALVALAVLPAAVCPRAGRAAGPRRRVYLRLMSYNIHVGVGMDKRQDLRRIADIIKVYGCDLVGLQEVDRGVERTGRVDEVRELARLTGMDYAFAHNLDYQGGQYGVAVLSRFPILAIDHRRYAVAGGRERRGFLRVEVEIKGRRLGFVTTHLDYQSGEGRLTEARQLLKALGEVRGPVVVTGDFNEDPFGGVYELMRAAGFADGWRRGHGPSREFPGEGATYPADKPTKRIDYVFYRGLGEDRPPEEDEDAGEAVPDTLASDHRPIVIGLWF
jgi:endonuclease/exonuclease/phosphatase family metal-dependent hydrolase